MDKNSIELDLVMEFFRGIKLPLPAGKLLEIDISFAKEFIGRHSTDSALRLMRLFLKHYPALNLKNPVTGLGILIRPQMSWVLKAVQEREDALPREKPEGGWSAKDWADAEFNGCHPRELAAKARR